MKTKRLFLKLFLAVCFLMAVPAMRAEAADSLYLDRGEKIIIDENGAKYGEKGEYIVNGTGYTITGRASGNNTINIEVPGNLTLTFDNITCSGTLNINIKAGIVTVAIKGSNRIVAGTGSAISINENAQLHFTSDISDNNTPNISIVGGTSSSAVKGGKFYVNGKNLSVSLYAGTGSKPFGEGELSVAQGTLKCFDNNGSKSEFGDGKLVQTGGNIVANGLASIDMSQEIITGLKWGDYDFWMHNEMVTPEYINTNNAIKINTSWHGQQFEIQPKKGSGGTTTSSIAQVLDIPNRRSKPTGLQATSETTAGEYGSIAKVNETMQYSSDGGKADGKEGRVSV